MTSFTLASETPSLAASLVMKASRSASCSLTRSPRTFFSAALSLACVTPSSLASAATWGGPPGRRGAVTEAGAGAAAGARAGQQVGERGAQLGLGDADLLREVGERGLVGAAVLPGLERVERGADLGLVDAELGREGVVEALDAVAAALAADDLAVAVELVERGRDLGLVETELGGQRLGQRLLAHLALAAAVGTQVLERRAQLRLGHAELGGGVGEVARAGAAGVPGAGGAGLGGGVPPASAVPSLVWVPSA